MNEKQFDAIVEDFMAATPWPNCGCFHHGKADQHSLTDECKPMERFMAAHAAVLNALKDRSRRRRARRLVTIQ